jgi:HupE / UreJ protein
MTHLYKYLWAFVWAMGVLVWGAGSAHAHKGSDAYLDVQEASGQSTSRTLNFVLSVAVKDLDLAIPVDANADGQVTWGEVKAAVPVLQALLNQSARLSVPDAGACRLDWQFKGAERRSDGAYLQFTAQAVCAPEPALGFNYTLFKAQDANHRLLIAGQIAGKDFLTTASPQQAAAVSLGVRDGANTFGAPGDPIDRTGQSATKRPAPDSRWSALWDYFSLGLHHLLEGYDHLAFLLALVLPLQLSLGFRSRGADAGVTALPAQRKVWLSLLSTVTAFTIGHSVTLVLATLGWTSASPQWVEPVIALSIAATAMLNLWPIKGLRTDVLALGFGMVHGYGFAGLLQEAAAPQGLLPYALAGFNLGIEAGQLLAVSAWVLLSQFVVNRAWYPSLVVRRGSQLLTLLAVWWFWQRVA